MAWAAVFRLVGSAAGAGGGGGAAAGGAAAGGGVQGVLGKATGAMKNFGGTVQGEMFKALSSFELVKKALGGIISGFQGAAAQAKQFTNLASRFNMPASQIASLSEYANSAGVSLNVLARGMMQIQSMGQRIDTAKKFKEIKAMVGLTSDEINKLKKGGVEGMVTLAGKMKLLNDEGDKMKVLTAVFGARGAMQMRGVMDQSEQEIREGMGKSYGVDESAIRESKKAEKAMGDLMIFVKTTGAQLFAALTPVIINVVKQVGLLMWGFEKLVTWVRTLGVEIQIMVQKAMLNVPFMGDKQEQAEMIAKLEQELRDIESASKKAAEHMRKLLGYGQSAAEAAKKGESFYKFSMLAAEDIAKAAEEAAVSAEKESKWRMYTADQLAAHNARAEALERRKLQEDEDDLLEEEKSKIREALGDERPAEETDEDRRFNAENATAIAMGRVERRVTGVPEKGKKEKELEGIIAVKERAAQIQRERSNQAELDAAPDWGTETNRFTGVVTRVNRARGNSQLAAQAAQEAKEAEGEARRAREDLERMKRERAEKLAMFEPQMVNQDGSKIVKPEGYETWSKEEQQASDDTASRLGRRETRAEVFKRLEGIAGLDPKVREIALRNTKLDEQERQNRLAEASKKGKEEDSVMETRTGGQKFFQVFERYANEKTNPLANMDIDIYNKQQELEKATIQRQRAEFTKDMDPEAVAAARRTEVDAKSGLATSLLQRRDKMESFYMTSGDSLQGIGGGGSTALSATSIMKKQADDVEVIRKLFEQSVAGLGNDYLRGGLDGSPGPYQSNMQAFDSVLATEKVGSVVLNR